MILYNLLLRPRRHPQEVLRQLRAPPRRPRAPLALRRLRRSRRARDLPRHAHPVRGRGALSGTDVRIPLDFRLYNRISYTVYFTYHHPYCQDVINLMKAVSFVESLISPELVQEFSHGLSRLSSPGDETITNFGRLLHHRSRSYGFEPPRGPPWLPKEAQGAAQLHT